MMADKMGVTREMVLDGLSRGLEPLEFIHALWEGGAIGYGRLDDWSDIDLYVLVDDGKIGEAFEAIESVLSSVAPIAIKYDVGPTSFQGVSQAFYRLEGSSRFMFLDLAVVTESAPDKLLEEETHGKSAFLFSKKDIEVPKLDRTALKEVLRKRVARLRMRMDLFNVHVQKELNRGQLIEAVDAYNVVVLSSLTEMLRIRYHPVHHAFRARYLYRELPEDVVKRLEDLHLVKDKADLERKYAAAMRWFDEVHEEVVSIGVDRLVDG